MTSSIFCNPINPHTELIDENCVVIFQNSPYPNIIVRPTSYGALKPYFVSPIKNLECRTPLYYIAASDTNPELYLYEYYNTVINKIIQNPPDSGCNSPENLSDSSSCTSDDLESSSNKLQSRDQNIQTSVETKDISIQCNLKYDIGPIVYLEERTKYLQNKYFNIWKKRCAHIKSKFLKIWVQNTKLKIIEKKNIRKKLKKLKKQRNKQLVKETISHWISLTNYQRNLKSKYLNIWSNYVKKNKKLKVKCIIQWKKVILQKKKNVKNYFNIWKIKTQNLKMNKEVIILHWKTYIKYKNSLRSKYFNIWKKKTFNKPTITKSKVFNKIYVSIFKYLNFDTFQELIKAFPSFKIYLHHPKIRDSYAHHLMYFELYCRKLIKITTTKLEEKFNEWKYDTKYNKHHIKWPPNLEKLNRILDARIVFESIRNMYDCGKLERTISGKNLNSLEDSKKKIFIQDFIKNDKSINKDVYFIMLGESIIINKFCFKTKSFIEYYCSSLQYLEVIIYELQSYYRKIHDCKQHRYFDKKNNQPILEDITDKIYTPVHRDITQILKQIIECKVLLKEFSNIDTFDHIHILICEIISLLDIYRDTFITWIGAFDLYKEFYHEWFSTKNKYQVNLSPITYKLTKTNLERLENNMLSRFEYYFNENKQDNINNALGTIFTYMNPIKYKASSTYMNPIKYKAGSKYKLKVKEHFEPRTVIYRSTFLDTISYINEDENKCKPGSKEKILKLRKKKLKNFKTSEYKDLLLVEDCITEDYYICKKSELLICKSKGFSDKNMYLSLV